MQQSHLSTRKSSVTTTARQTPFTPLKLQLISLIKEEMRRSKVGYIKLSRLTGIDRDQLQRVLGPREQGGMVLYKLCACLHALGYECEFKVSPREMSEDERNYLYSYGAASKRYKPREETYSTARFPIRVVESRRLGRGEEETQVSSSSKVQH